MKALGDFSQGVTFNHVGT